jgi:serine/threonine protein kinase
MNGMKPLEQLFPGHAEDHQAIDLVLKMLEFHPNRRISIEKALEHPFLSSLHNPEDEPVANFTFTFDFENEELSKERIQELMWEETRTYHPEISPTYPSMSRRKLSQAKEQDMRSESKTSNIHGEKSMTKGPLKRSIEEK